MKILGKNGLGKILKIFLIIVIICLVPLLIVSPLLLNHTRNIYYSMFIVYPNGILMLCVVYQFIKLFKSLEKSDPFNFDNVNTLKKTSLVSLVIGILWIIDLIFMIFVIQNTYINYIIVLSFLALLFIGVAIALYILAELFKQATNYKEENDLTI